MILPSVPTSAEAKGVAGASIGTCRPAGLLAGPIIWALTERPPRRLHRTGCDRSPDDGRTGRPSSLFRPDRVGAVSDSDAGPPPLRWAKATAGRSAGGRLHCTRPARCFRPPNGRQQQAPLRSPCSARSRHDPCPGADATNMGPPQAPGITIFLVHGRGQAGGLSPVASRNPRSVLQAARDARAG